MVYSPKRAVAHPGFQRGGGGGGGCLRSGPIRKVGGGGGGGVCIRSETKKWGLGWGGGGWGGVRFRSDAFLWHTENTLPLIINGTWHSIHVKQITYRGRDAPLNQSETPSLR